MIWFKSKEKIREQSDGLIKQAIESRDKVNLLEAIALLERAIHLDKEYATSYGEYGITLAMQKNNDERAVYNGHIAIIKDSKNALQWRNLAHIYYLLGRYNFAYSCILYAEKLNPKLENLGKIKSTLETVMGKDYVFDMGKIKENIEHAYSRYKYKDIIMPEPFLNEILQSK